MTDHLCIGPAPCDEPCAQVGEDDFMERATDECSRFIDLIRKTVGPEPDGARLKIKWFNHDLGSYPEVVVYFNTDKQEAVDYAFKCESEAPMNWS